MDINSELVLLTVSTLPGWETENMETEMSADGVWLAVDAPVNL